MNMFVILYIISLIYCPIDFIKIKKDGSTTLRNSIELYNHLYLSIINLFFHKINSFIEKILSVVTAKANTKLLDYLFINRRKHNAAMHFAVFQVAQLLKCELCVIIRNG